MRRIPWTMLLLVATWSLLSVPAVADKRKPHVPSPREVASEYAASQYRRLSDPLPKTVPSPAGPEWELAAPTRPLNDFKNGESLTTPGLSLHF